MAFESFYGGRQGASFVIVKQFDAIDKDKTSTPYKGTYLAVTNDPVDPLTNLHTYLYDDVNSKFIERDASNYPNYVWNYTVLDGSNVPVKYVNAGTESTQALPVAAAEGMVQCFSKGGDTTDEVNYGEYVIIDTPNKSDPDNGKVYRRGLFYDDDDRLRGAEYIGQIVGPQGEATEIAVGHEGEIKQHPNYNEGNTIDYSTQTGDIVPGREGGYDGRPEQYLGTYTTNVYTEILDRFRTPSPSVLYKVTNANTLSYEYYSWTRSGGWIQEYPQYHDKITFSWVTLRDQYGHIQTALIGFTVPHLVQDIVATRINAYYNIDPTTGERIDKNLIERTDDFTHPYYERWKLLVPDGVKGDALKDLEIYNTEVKQDIPYYSDTACTQEVGITSSRIPLTDPLNINFDLTYIPVTIDENQYYIKNDPEHSTTTTSRLRYTEINYDKNATGENSYQDVSPYNTIRSTRITEKGDLFIDYTYDNEKEIGRIQLVNNALGEIGKVDDLTHLEDDNGTPIPPEYMVYAEEQRAAGNPYIYDPTVGEDDRYIGWVVSVDSGDPDESPDVWAYDYILEEWYWLGKLDGSMANPEVVFAISDEAHEPERLAVKGTWAVSSTRKCV